MEKINNNDLENVGGGLSVTNDKSQLGQVYKDFSAQNLKASDVETHLRNLARESDCADIDKLCVHDEDVRPFGHERIRVIATHLGNEWKIDVDFL